MNLENLMLNRNNKFSLKTEIKTKTESVRKTKVITVIPWSKYYQSTVEMSEREGHDTGILTIFHSKSYVH